MATAETLTGTIDRVIALFNAKAMDLPDGFFDRRTQFRLNGAPFETLLGQSPTDPLVLMLATLATLTSISDPVVRQSGLMKR